MEENANLWGGGGGLHGGLHAIVDGMFLHAESWALG